VLLLRLQFNVGENRNNVAFSLVFTKLWKMWDFCSFNRGWGTFVIGIAIMYLLCLFLLYIRF